jgi:hypothetical protein
MMTQEESLLWSKLQHFRFDDPDHQFKFSDRLARENGWTTEYTHRVLEEYRKFLFLCCVAAPATPSDPVDQAWHLHLTFTRSYWLDLCKNTLGKEIHHGPTKGGKKEHVKFNAFYTNTLKVYREKFGFDAPDDIWHDNETRFSNVVYQRVDITNNWIVPKPKSVDKTIKLFNRVKNMKRLFPIGISLIGFSFIQAVSGWQVFWIIVGILLFIWILTLIFGGNKKNRGGGSSSSSGCGGGVFFVDSGCSSTDSGCSGCGGCGGD